MNYRLIGALLLVAANASAQTIKGAVLAKGEPHHHLAYEDATLRVLRVRVPAHDTTLLHEHGPDYFWIALGPSTVVNAKLGAPDATISSADLSMHYTPGNFAHVARNPGGTPFDNITVELLGKQTNVRNLCEAAIGGKSLDCRTTPSSFEGATERTAFATDQLKVSLLTIPAGSTLRTRPGARGVWLIALDTMDVATNLTSQPGDHWVGGTLDASRGAPLKIVNKGKTSVRAIAVEK